jgi:hypothetical protein
MMIDDDMISYVNHAARAVPHSLPSERSPPGIAKSAIESSVAKRTAVNDVESG